MTRPTFTEALNSRPWLLADGATGTNYFQMGLATRAKPSIATSGSPTRTRPGTSTRRISDAASLPRSATSSRRSRMAIGRRRSTATTAWSPSPWRRARSDRGARTPSSASVTRLAVSRPTPTPRASARASGCCRRSSPSRSRRRDRDRVASACSPQRRCRGPCP